VEHHWRFKDSYQAKTSTIEGFDFVIIGEADKQQVRDNIISCLCKATDPRIINQYKRCIAKMALFDYPHSWPNLLQEANHFLSQQDEKSVLSGLTALYCLVKKYEFELDEDRQPLNDIVMHSIGLLGDLINQVVNVESEGSLQMLHLICKIFYTANQLRMCPFLLEGHNLDPWIQFFKTLLDRPLPPELEAFTEEMGEIEARDKSTHWKIKSIAAKITYRVFHKYGNPQAVEEEYVDFSKYFKDTFAIALLESHLQIVFKRKNFFVGTSALNYALRFVNQATRLATTMSVLKPFVENLLFETVVPIMLVQHKDVVQHREDPVEFIRKQRDVTKTYLNPRETVLELMEALCSYRSNKKVKRPDYLNKFLEFCVSNLAQYQQHSQADWRIKEAILNAIGVLKDLIRKF